MSLPISIWEIREQARAVVIFAPWHTELGPQFRPVDTLSHLICLLVCLFVLFDYIYF